MDYRAPLRIKFSELLELLNSNSTAYGLHFGILAANLRQQRNREHPLYALWNKLEPAPYISTASDSQLHQELLRIMPEHVQPTISPHTGLQHWLKNMPADILVPPRLNHDARTRHLFNKKFLLWAIEKYGDLSLTFTFK